MRNSARFILWGDTNFVIIKLNYVIIEVSGQLKKYKQIFLSSLPLAHSTIEGDDTLKNAINIHIWRHIPFAHIAVEGGGTALYITYYIAML